MSYIASFDIGSKNFAFYIEKMNRDKIKLLNSNSTIHDIFQTGEPHLFLLRDISTNKKRNGLFIEVIKLLDQYETIFNECDVILIEHQIRRNVIATKIAQTVLTYFLVLYPEKDVVMYSSRNKTKALNAPSGLDGRGRKKWASNVVTELLETIKETEKGMEIHKYFHSQKKKDDLADTLLQVLSYKIKLKK